MKASHVSMLLLVVWRGVACREATFHAVSRTLHVLGRTRRSQRSLVPWLAVSDTARLCACSLEQLGLHEEVPMSDKFCRFAHAPRACCASFDEEACGNGAHVQLRFSSAWRLASCSPWCCGKTHEETKVSEHRHLADRLRGSSTYR